MAKNKNDNEFGNIPVGFGMKLAQNTDAMTYFTSLNEKTRSGIISYIQSSRTGDDAKSRIDTVVNNLKDHKPNILS